MQAAAGRCWFACSGRFACAAGRWQSACRFRRCWRCRGGGGGGGEPLALRVAAALGIEHWLHQASPDLLAPLASPAITGTIARRERWTAVLDPARLAATAETD